MLSIIIPVLNESENITALLTHLVENSRAQHISEIIVVDGGSTDTTCQLTTNFAENTTLSVQLFSSERGRAKQMNLGAKQAKGDILYFLHADSYPPKDFDSLIISEVQKDNLAGCFRMKFKSTHWWLRLAGWFTKFNWRACRGGDQSQFIIKDLFNEIGGYDETYTIYEDNILISELYERKQFVVIQHWLYSSARRYEHHSILKLQYHFLTIYVKKFFGASADDLYAYYQKYIQK